MTPADRERLAARLAKDIRDGFCVLSDLKEDERELILHLLDAQAAPPASAMSSSKEIAFAILLPISHKNEIIAGVNSTDLLNKIALALTRARAEGYRSGQEAAAQWCDRSHEDCVKRASVPYKGAHQHFSIAAQNFATAAIAIRALPLDELPQDG